MNRRKDAKLYDKTAGWIIASLMATIMAFLAATTFVQGRTEDIHDLATEIASVTAPSIEHLARARGDLRRIETLLTIYLNGKMKGEGEGLSRENRETLHEIDRMRQRFVANIDAYKKLPLIPGERIFQSQIVLDAERINEKSERIIELAEAGQIVEASEIFQRYLIPEAEAAGLVLIRAISLNGDKVRDGANEIESSRQTTVRIAYGLDGLSVLLACVAGLVAFRGIRQYMQIVEEQQRELTRHNEELEIFAARVAHDIRGPLTPVVMALDLGRAQAIDDKARRVFEAASRSVFRVQHLVDGLLTFARAGAVPDPEARCQAKTVLGGIIEEVLPEAEAGKIHLKLEVLPLRDIRCEEAVLVSIISNLVRNAIKFMGEVEVREVRVSAREAGDKALFEVIDTGPGFSEEVAERIFEPYVRAPGAKSTPGIGLGLATVKRLTLAHHGNVGVESKPEEGTRFWVELPLVQS